ncbi:hypothetical protein [Winogradskyella sp. 3972H.M.0a.05]|uniref:hypothetical protein n=1 Tax=Winogradskyella sp. 3972H.M.0a.05 TaxID=2950277 RepID=UPI00339B0F05
MKRLVYIVLFITVSFSSLIGAQDWNTVKNTDFGYRVDFPAYAEKASTDIPTAKGNVVMHTYTCTATSSDSNLMYMSSFTQYPLSFFPEGLDSPEVQNTLLENSINGAVTNVKGTLLSKESIVFNGYPGRFYKIEVDQGDLYVLSMWSILVDYKLYMIQTIALKDKSDNTNAKRFRDSFELIKVKN